MKKEIWSFHSLFIPKRMFNVHLNHHYYKNARKFFKKEIKENWRWKMNEKDLNQDILLCVRFWRKKKKISSTSLVTNINADQVRFICAWKKEFCSSLLFLYNNLMFISDYFVLCLLKAQSKHILKCSLCSSLIFFSYCSRKR